jgi:beta-xylosidase
MEALADFDVTVTFCFTPEHRGIAPHHSSPPQVKEEFAEFCASMIRRYAPHTDTSPPQQKVLEAL